MSDYYDRQGRPLTSDEWARMFNDWSVKNVAQTKLGDCSVSTVWLGLDHGWGIGHTALIFETLVFGGEFDQEMDRYATEAEALAGHEAMVAKIRESSRAKSGMS